MNFKLEWPLPVNYKDVRLDCGYRIDFPLEEKPILECKSVESRLPIHEAQLMTYLKLTGCEVGLHQNLLTEYSTYRLRAFCHPIRLSFLF